MKTACRHEPGTLRPRVDRRRCEGKAECVRVCPYDVFEVGPIDEHEYQSFSLLVRLKLRVHGKKTAHTPRADACRSCGLCVSACPEHAITLAPP
jgi:NAD-dependent dihydropyrimidine dehydrogenase PreA subunit